VELCVLRKAVNLIDVSAVIFLCLLGSCLILLVWLAGMPAIGPFADLWRHFGVVNLFFMSVLCFLIAAAILRRMFVLGCSYRRGLLVILFFTCLPTLFFATVLLGKAIHSYA